jgi:hypothetical protein
VPPLYGFLDLFCVPLSLTVYTYERVQYIDIGRGKCVKLAPVWKKLDIFKNYSVR